MCVKKQYVAQVACLLCTGGCPSAISEEGAGGVTKRVLLPAFVLRKSFLLSPQLHLNLTLDSSMDSNTVKKKRHKHSPSVSHPLTMPTASLSREESREARLADLSLTPLLTEPSSSAGMKRKARVRVPSYGEPLMLSSMLRSQFGNASSAAPEKHRKPEPATFLTL